MCVCVCVCVCVYAHWGNWGEGSDTLTGIHDHMSLSACVLISHDCTDDMTGARHLGRGRRRRGWGWRGERGEKVCVCV